jgi:DNA-binding NarL/FixJ family response regulator
VPLTCLIVDDRDEFLESASHLLTSQGVMVVARASCGRDALALADGHGPDVALVDVELGDEDGIAVARQLADARSVSHVILISVRDHDEIVELMADSGVVGFLRKDTLDVRAITDLIGPRGPGNVRSEPPRADR